MGEPYDAFSPPMTMTRPERPFVVGLGASAGGIAALQSFLLTSETGIGAVDCRTSARRLSLQLIARIGGDLDFLSWQLRPTALDELGLAAALARFVTEWSSHVGIPAEFRLTGYERGRLLPEAEVAFYRVTQEALTNVAKHAHATRADVVLGMNDGQVVLVIEDDGIGFDAVETATSTSNGFGLLGMRERAALAGASLQIETAPGRGTSIFLRRHIEPAWQG
jgi:signal transduction histidine kinase